MVNRKKIAEDFVHSIKSDSIHKIILFGSVARNEDNDDSDIDILIVADNYLKIEPQISEGIYNAIRDYGELISAHFMTPETFNKTKNYSFLTRVLKEGINLVWSWRLHIQAYSKLKSSKQLYEVGQYPDSVSLSYYAMYSAATAMLLKIGISTTRHKGTMNEIFKNYVKTGKLDHRVYVNFAGTQSLRETSDYSAIVDIDEKIAKIKIEQAEEFIKEAEKIIWN